MKKSVNYFIIFVTLIYFFSTHLENVSGNSQLHSLNYAVYDTESDCIIYGKNIDTIASMASTTKIMTLIIALENCDSSYVATASAYAESMPEVKLFLHKGDQFIMSDLFFSLMLESHNDTAVTIAENVALYHILNNIDNPFESYSFIPDKADNSDFISNLSIDNSHILVNYFIDLMNKKAKELNLNNTHFVTPNGLDESDSIGPHSTCAADLAKLMAYCIKSNAFVEITQTKSITISSLDEKKYNLNNKNTLLSNPDLISGKTGFTNKAGYCYVCAITINNRILTIALLQSGWPPNKSFKWNDTNKIIQLIKNNYPLKNKSTSKIYKLPK